MFWAVMPRFGNTRKSFWKAIANGPDPEMTSRPDSRRSGISTLTESPVTTTLWFAEALSRTTFHWNALAS
ncbi:hypothetical protein D3C86_2176850 [compost metagenome]